jgi:pyruvate,orthophosphate dikinase
MAAEGAISRREAIARVEPVAVQDLLRAQLPPAATLEARGIVPATRGLPASAGAASGRVVFDPDAAIALRADGERPILVRRETSPEDVHGMRAAEGVLTAAGGMTSHAAVVARGLGRPCVAGCGELRVDYATRRIAFATPGRPPIELGEGDWITLDGTTGNVYPGEIELVAAPAIPEVETLLGWADSERCLSVLAIASDPAEAALGRAFGADAILASAGEADWADASFDVDDPFLVRRGGGSESERALRLDTLDLPAEALVLGEDEKGLVAVRGMRPTHIERAKSLGLAWVAVPVGQVPMARLGAAQSGSDPIA